uniref:BACK domain-containing protein n=1 Tax=Globodera pallida TaxID=36090 RepID=A0A183BS89_GLOPA
MELFFYNERRNGPPNTNRFKTKRMLLTVFSSAQPSAVSQMPCGADKGQQIQDEQHQLLQLSAPYSGGMDCYADDRDALNDFAKYFNNAHLSDMSLAVGDELPGPSADSVPKHQKWNGDKKELELTEEPQCQAMFGPFLRFLYCNHIVLSVDNALPVLILADKYNVTGLKKICIDFAINYVLPELKLKDLFHLWFNYSTKAYHVPLIKVCIGILAKQFKELATSDDWAPEWAELDRDQLIEFLRSNDLVVPNEFFVWEGVLKWMAAPAHPERRGTTSSPILVQILPLIRFPFMSTEELLQIEDSKLAKTPQLSKLFTQHTHLAFKFISLPLASRTKLINETNGPQFLLRNYTEVQWDKRMCLTAEQLYLRNQDHSFKVTTKSSSLTLPSWEWKLDFQVAQNLATVSDELRLQLTAVDVDHSCRSVEYMLMLCGQKRVLRTVTGTKLFTKSRFSAELDLRGKLALANRWRLAPPTHSPPDHLMTNRRPTRTPKPELTKPLDII